jgi:hypothetical protein
MDSTKWKAGRSRQSLKSQVSDLFSRQVVGTMQEKPIRMRGVMPAAATKKKLKLFHANMVVTRIEQWCVEAESAEEARELLTGGEGHRCHFGDRVHAEVQNVLDE